MHVKEKYLYGYSDADKQKSFLDLCGRAGAHHDHVAKPQSLPGLQTVAHKHARHL